MGQTRLKLWGGGIHASTHTCLHIQNCTHNTSFRPLSRNLPGYFYLSSLSLAWLTSVFKSVSNTYSIKQDLNEMVKFIPAWCPLSAPPSASQLSHWELVFVNLDSNTHFLATFLLCQRSLKQNKKSANKTTVITVASFYRLNSVWLQYSGLKYYFYSVDSLRGPHESNLNR